MNLKTVFRIGAIILLINGLGGLFATKMFMEAGNFTMTPALLTIGQFYGSYFLGFGINWMENC